MKQYNNNTIPSRDVGTTSAAGAIPAAFCLDNFTGALRVQNEGAAERVWQKKIIA